MAFLSLVGSCWLAARSLPFGVIEKYTDITSAESRKLLTAELSSGLLISFLNFSALIPSLRHTQSSSQVCLASLELSAIGAQAMAELRARQQFHDSTAQP